LIAFLLVILGWSRPAEANLLLTLDESSYTINGIGNTVAVEVFVSQNSTGTQVGVGNELLTGAIQMTFATAGAATVVSNSNVTFNPAWDSGSVSSSTSGPNTLVNLGVTSLAGFSSLSPPLLLGTFVFTGQFVGSTTITVASLAPGPSFITAQGDNLDPTSGPSAQIVVTSAVPEPGAVMLLGIGGLVLGAGWLRRRARTAATST